MLSRVKKLLFIVLSCFLLCSTSICVFASSDDTYEAEKQEKIALLEEQIAAIEESMAKYEDHILTKEEALEYEELIIKCSRLENQLASYNVDTDTESFIKAARAKVAKVWIKYIIAGVAAILVLGGFTYYQFSKSIWVAGIKEQEERKLRLEKFRNVIIAGIVLAGVAFIILIRVYMEPYNIKRSYDGYNINFIGRSENTGGWREDSYIITDLVVRRVPFDVPDITGTIISDGIRYVEYTRYKSYVSYDDNVYFFHFLEEGADFLELDRAMYIRVTKDFSVWEYWGANHASDEAFAAPADNAEQAREIFRTVWNFD